MRKEIGKCPICNTKPTKKNHWVRYHIKYDPPMVIFACKFCNFTEMFLRTGRGFPHKGALNKKRINAVIFFHSLFNVKL